MRTMHVEADGVTHMHSRVWRNEAGTSTSLVLGRQVCGNYSDPRSYSPPPYHLPSSTQRLQGSEQSLRHFQRRRESEGRVSQPPPEKAFFYFTYILVTGFPGRNAE